MAKKMILAATMADVWLPAGENGEMHLFKKGEQLLELPQDWYPVFKKLGFSFLQFDSLHLNTNEVSENCWDWTKEDDWVEKCLTNGFKPMYFPHWHCPPKWYLNSENFTGCKCLQHNKENIIFSLWSPKIKPWFQRCIKALREQYSDEQIPAIYLGIYGDFGEAMFPMDDHIHTERLLQERGNTENAHWHGDFWCNDEYAKKNFNDFLLKKYDSLSNLNSTWSSQFDSAEKIQYPQNPDENNKRPWLDFIQWRYDSMTNFAAFVAETYRKYFPNAILMLPMGGGVEPIYHGQDNTALPKAMKPYNIHIRSTAAGSAQFFKGVSIPEKFQINYPRLKRVFSASKFYGLPGWLEPPYPPSLSKLGTLTMIFEALCCGVAGYYDWSHTVYKNREVFEKYKDFLNTEDPQVDVALFFPTSTHRLHTDSTFPPVLLQGCSDIRKIIDYDILDELLITDGALKNYRLLILFEGNVIEESTLQAIQNWIQKGGVVLSYNLGPVATVEGDKSVYNNIFGITSSSKLVTADVDDIVIENKHFLKHVDSLSSLSISSSYAELAKDIEVLASTDKGEPAIWTKKAGKGHAVHFTGTWKSRNIYYELIRDAIYNLSALDPSLTNAPEFNNEWDNVFSVLCSDKIIFLNMEDHPVTKTAYSKTIKLEPYSIDLITK